MNSENDKQESDQNKITINHESDQEPLSTQYRNLSKSIGKLNKALTDNISLDLQTGITSSFITISNSINQITRSLVDINSIANTQRIFTAMANSLIDMVNLSQFSESMMKIVSSQFEILSQALSMRFPYEEFQKISNRLQYPIQVKEAFIDSGWPISKFIPKKVVDRIVDIHQEGKIQYSSNVMLGFFKKQNYSNLSNMVLRWENNDLFSKRKRLIAEAIDNHKRGNYHSSINILLPLIEGIMTEFLLSNNLDVQNWSDSQLAKAEKKAQEFIGDKDDYSLADYAIAAVIEDFLLNQLYSWASFSSENKKPESKRKKNRHSILHGMTSEYGTASLSLKFFILLDAIFDLITTYESYEND